MFCNQFSLHGIHTLTTLCRTSVNAPFSDVLTKKGDCMPLQHLQIVVVYLSANMWAWGNAFINTTSPKTTRRNPVHVAQLRGIGMKLLSFTNEGKKNFCDSWRDNIEQKRWHSQQRCPPTTCSLITLKFSCSEAEWETKLLVPPDQLSWFMSGTRHARRFLFEIPSMLDNQKHSPHLPPSKSTSGATRALGLHDDCSNRKMLKNQKAFPIWAVFAFWSERAALLNSFDI